MNTQSATISKHFLTAILYNDDTGLDDDEIKLLDDYLASNKLGHVIITDYDSLDDTNFTHCDILGLYSDCIEVEFYILGE